MRQELREWMEELACRAGLDGMPAAARGAALVLAIVLVGVAVWWWGGAPGGEGVDGATAPVLAEEDATQQTEGDSSLPASPASVTVHVVGAVRHPGVYVLPSGARATDAVVAAGGALGSADQSGINLARQVADGEQLVVPVRGTKATAAGQPVGAGPGAAGGAGAAGGTVDLNTATPAQLDVLPGVGPATAAKIVADRTENGPFRSPEDLMRVPGIGAKRFESLKDMVTAR